MTGFGKGTLMRIAGLAFSTSMNLFGNTAAFFIEFFQGHFFLRRRQCLGTPNIKSCQLVYQVMEGRAGEKN